MEIQYLTISINPPPLDTEILVKKENGIAEVLELKSREASQEWHTQTLLSDEYRYWAKV